MTAYPIYVPVYMFGYTDHPDEEGRPQAYIIVPASALKVAATVYI